MAWADLGALSRHADAPVEALFTDIDDTLTTSGRLPAEAFHALWRLHERAIPVFLVTGRPAGWCDLLARQWPVSGVIGENGGLAYRYDPEARRIDRVYARDPAERARDAEALSRIEAEVRASVPGARVAADQPFRLFDLAIDFAEDAGPLGPEAVDQIVAIFTAHGARAKVSSIHVNGWFGDFDKLTMIERCARDWLGRQGDLPPGALYVGDSPNDEPAFAAFPRSVGVANVRRFAERLTHPPTFVTRAEGGAGFAELVDHLLG
jgi:HAD superfamily hydrolase (TIGR01484 family)